MRAKNLADLYELPLVDWERITKRLQGGITLAPGTGGPDRHTCWLVTINLDGSPHITGVGALWEDGAFWFETGEATKKAKNLARDPRCALSVTTTEFDLAIEGDAQRISDPATVGRMAALWASHGWPAMVDQSGQALTAEYSAPSAGPPPWSVYRIGLRQATVLAVQEPAGATKWEFTP
jgi:Pyridoxamine 5'-phosphate oxidase